MSGLTEQTVSLERGDIFVRSMGSGPPLLMLHGYPQTSAMWRKVAPHLAQHFTVYCPDLRGYGRSHKPATAPDHSPYSKREMAADMHALMDHFGHARFDLVGHDRGGRVAHRLAMDAPERVRRLAVLDIAPTREMYANTTNAFARAYWHWFFLIRPAPMVETCIGADPRGYWLSKCGSNPGGLDIFDGALEEYLSAFEDPDVIHASCEDYRAAATIDIAHDDADGAARLPMPLLALWGSKGVIEACFDACALWSLRAEDVRGEAIPTGHYMAEERPDLVIDKLLKFFTE